LWRLLYETAARASEVLSLNVEDVDLENRRAIVCSKGGDIELLHFQTRFGASARAAPADGYAQSALAPATRRAYESDWRAFADWCAARGLTPTPATAATVAAFLAAETRRGCRHRGSRAAGGPHRARGWSLVDVGLVSSVGGATEPGGEGVGGVAIEMLVGGHVAAGGARVGVAHGVLDVLQRDAGVVEAGGEAVAQAVRAELGGGLDLGAAGEAADEPPGLGLVYRTQARKQERAGSVVAPRIGSESHVEGSGDGAAAASPHRRAAPVTSGSRPCRTVR
jgi:hypothetical protein